MRVFCWLAAIALIAGSIWLFALGMIEGFIWAASLIYPLGCVVLFGEAFLPLAKQLPRRSYNGESLAELARRDLEDLRRLKPNSKWISRYPQIQAGLLLGFLLWVLLLVLLATR